MRAVRSDMRWPRRGTKSHNIRSTAEGRPVRLIVSFHASSWPLFGSLLPLAASAARVAGPAGTRDPDLGPAGRLRVLQDHHAPRDGPHEGVGPGLGHLRL